MTVLEKTTIFTTAFENLEQLHEAVGRMLNASRVLGHQPDTVYIRPTRIGLVEETLTDGSTVLDVIVYEAP